MSEACLLCGLVDETSTLCCLSSSCICELIAVSTTGDVSWLAILSPLRLSIVSSMISSSYRGFNLFISAPGCSTGPLMGVASSLSLFLPFSSFRGVFSDGIFGALVCTGRIFFYWSVMACCFVPATSLPFEELETGVLASCIGYCEVPAEDIPTSAYWGSLKDTCPKESRSRVFSKSFMACSIFSCRVNSSTNVPSIHSSWLAYCSTLGILWCV